MIGGLPLEPRRIPLFDDDVLALDVTERADGYTFLIANYSTPWYDRRLLRAHPHRRGGQCRGPSNFGIELRSLTHACCERTNICRRGTNSFRRRSAPSRTL
jgi:hypothetical protein